MSDQGALPLVDLSYLNEYTDGDEEVMDELIEVFYETASGGLEDLKNSIHETEMTVWKSAAHILKGASGYLGASQMNALCAETEQLDEATSQERADFHEKIEESYENVRAFLQARKV